MKIGEGFRQVKQGFDRKVNEFLRGPSGIPMGEPNLPPDVLFTLQYQQARLSKDNLISMVSRGFIDHATTLILNGFDLNRQEQDKASQEQLLNKIIETMISKNPTGESLKSVLLQTLEEHPDIIAPGGKIAQINRQGYDFWRSEHKKKAQEVKGIPRKPVLALIHYHTLLGLGTYVEEFKDSETPLYIFMPGWCVDPTNPDMGYKIDFRAEKKVRLVAKAEQKEDNIVTIIDTRKTGGMEKSVWSILEGKPVEDILIDDRKMLRIAHVPQGGDQSDSLSE